MQSFELYGCTSADIKNLTEDDLYEREFTNELYNINEKSEFLRIKGLVLNHATKLGIGPDYKEFLTECETEIDEFNDSAEFNHQTNFGLNGWENLNCGQWIADKKGIRKKGLKTFASLSPIQPVEILENKSSGVEKVKLQFFKNGRTRYLITDRNTIASKSSIVRLASQGIEVTSETAGQLVSYLFDVINLNPLPCSTAYSQMGWHGNLFIPYDKDAVFDGEEANRTLFKAFNEKGNFEKWLQKTREYRRNISIRLAMGAAFGSVLLEKIGALSFVFHLWGKSGTGKTVALMIAMSIWGDPTAGAAVRTLNMTQNAMVGQAAFLNSLPFAGDELQTIKEKFDNYDKLVMKCTEGMDKSRMLDGQRQAETKRWKCAFLFTGEDKITRPNSGAGVKNRCIEVEADSDLLEEGNEAVNIVEANHGHAGREFIKKIQLLNHNALRAEYNTLVLELAKAAGTEPKQAAAMAVIMLADTLARETFWKDENPLSFRDVLPFMATSEEINIAERAYDYIIDVIAKNQARFTYPDNNHGEFWGDNKDGVLYFNSTVLKDELQKKGFEFSSVAHSWAKSGYILTKERGYTISTTIDGIKARYVAIKLPDMPEEETESDYAEVITI